MDGWKVCINNDRQRKISKPQLTLSSIAALVSTPTSASARRTLNPNGSEMLVSSSNYNEGDYDIEMEEASEVEDNEGDDQTDPGEAVPRISGISVIATDYIPAGCKGESNLVN